MKHGKPRAIYGVLIVYFYFLLFALLPIVITVYFKWSPWILDYPIFAFAMFFASLWNYGLFIPVIALVLVTALSSYYIPRLLGLLLDFIETKRHP